MQFAAGGHLLKLDDLAGELKDQYLPLSNAAYVQFEGATYSVPWYTETRAVIYHKDLFEAAGVTVPETWQQWKDAAAALTKGDAQYGLVAWSEGTSAGQLWIPLATSAGGELVAADGTIQADTDPFRASLQLLADLYSSGSMPAGQPTYTDDQAVELFTAKKAAMLVANNNVWAALRANPLRP